MSARMIMLNIEVCILCIEDTICVIAGQIVMVAMAASYTLSPYAGCCIGAMRITQVIRVSSQPLLFSLGLSLVRVGGAVMGLPLDD